MATHSRRYAKQTLAVAITLCATLGHADEASLQTTVLGTWQTHSNGNLFLPSTDETYTFLQDSTFRAEVVADFGWPQGKKTSSNIGTYKVISDHEIRLMPNGGTDVVVEYERPSENVLKLKKDGKNQTLLRTTR